MVVISVIVKGQIRANGLRTGATREYARPPAEDGGNYSRHGMDGLGRVGEELRQVVAVRV